MRGITIIVNNNSSGPFLSCVLAIFLVYLTVFFGFVINAAYFISVSSFELGADRMQVYLQVQLSAWLGYSRNCLTIDIY